MATAKQKKIEQEYSVTLKIKGSKLEKMAVSANKIGVEVVKVRKASVMVPLTGEWTLTERPGSDFRPRVWNNTDGREIIWHPAYPEPTKPCVLLGKHYSGMLPKLKYKLIMLSPSQRGGIWIMLSA
jgi:hypothetical protein